eukprot:5011849-Pleurochrysis_carterae.AAC.1
MSTASSHVPKSQIDGSGHTLAKGTRRALFEVGRQARGGRTALRFGVEKWHSPASSECSGYPASSALHSAIANSLSSWASSSSGVRRESSDASADWPRAQSALPTSMDRGRESPASKTLPMASSSWSSVA